MKVTVLNGTTIPQLAAKVSAELAGRGFAVVGQPADAPTSNYVHTVIEYGSKADQAALDTLRQQIPGATVKLVPSVAAGTLTLILGTRFRNARRPEQAARDDLGQLQGEQPLPQQCLLRPEPGQAFR